MFGLNLFRAHITKELIKNFEDSGDVGYLKDAVELYLSSIEETTKKIRNLKYVYNSIEYDETDNTHHLIQEQYMQTQLQIPINGTLNKILSFNKNKT